MQPFQCPYCGNSTSEEGITYCYLEWRIMSVAGQDGGQILVEYDDNEGADVTEKDQITSAHVNSTEPQLDHYFCNKCSRSWWDQTKQEDAHVYRKRLAGK